MYVFGSGRGERCWGREDWVWALPILEEHWESGICVCVLVAWVVLEGVGGLGETLGGCGGIMNVCVVSLASFC